MSEQQSTELAAAQPSPLARVRMGDSGVQLGSMDDLWRFATMVHKSSFAPNGMDSVEKIAIAVEYGMELGIAPMQALQGMYVVNGRPSVYGDLFLAICKSDARWDENRFREWFTGEPYRDDYTAHCQMARLGVGNPHVESYSVADAKKGGLWERSGPWKQHPKRMLKMRARTFCGRDTFPERLRGLTTVEEAQDIIDVEVRDASPAIAMPRRIEQSPAPQPAAQSQPSDPPETTAAEQDAE